MFLPWPFGNYVSFRLRWVRRLLDFFTAASTMPFDCGWYERLWMCSMPWCLQYSFTMTLSSTGIETISFLRKVYIAHSVTSHECIQIVRDLLLLIIDTYMIRYHDDTGLPRVNSCKYQHFSNLAVEYCCKFSSDDFNHNVYRRGKFDV